MTYLILAAALLVVLQTALLELVRFHGVLPDLFLGLVVYASLYLGPSRSLVLGAAVGALNEMASPAAWGALPLLYGAAGWLSAKGWRRFLQEGPLTEALFLLFWGAVINGTLLLFEYGARGSAVRAFALCGLPNAAATALCAPLLYTLIRRKLLRRLGGLAYRAQR